MVRGSIGSWVNLITFRNACRGSMDQITKLQGSQCFKKLVYNCKSKFFSNNIFLRKSNTLDATPAQHDCTMLQNFYHVVLATYRAQEHIFLTVNSSLYIFFKTSYESSC